MLFVSVEDFVSIEIQLEFIRCFHFFVLHTLFFCIFPVNDRLFSVNLFSIIQFNFTFLYSIWISFIQTAFSLKYIVRLSIYFFFILLILELFYISLHCLLSIMLYVTDFCTQIIKLFIDVQLVFIWYFEFHVLWVYT